MVHVTSPKLGALKLGQADDAGSLPVVPSSDGFAVETGLDLSPLATNDTAAAILAKQTSDPATAALQGTGNTALSNILTKLPASPATADGQSAIDTKLASILAKQSADPSTATAQTANTAAITALSGKLPATLGQKTKAASLAVALASDSGYATETNQNTLNTAVGTTATAAATSNTGTFGIIAILKRLAAHYLSAKTTKGIQISASGDNTIIAAPAVGTEIVVTAIRLQNTTTTATSALIKKGASDAEPLRVRCPADGSGISESYGPGNSIRCGSGNALIVNLSVAQPHGVSVFYYLAGTTTGLPL